ncbi:MAG TPA: ABC transporter permease [Gemmatimonadales bacterium]|jgi:peptide/nickel transport system permease protein|nr:ABC transporter permease [Gemmatimonadales bacterium]
MARSILRGLLRGAAVVFGVVTLTFLLLHLAPGDPVQRLLGPAATLEQLEAGRHTLGLDRPLPEQYAAWLGRAVRGDFGASIAQGRPAAVLLAEAWPATALLILLSLVLSWLFGILVGTVQANTRRRGLDTTTSALAVALNAMPSYWLGLALVMVFTYQLRWLPAFGAAGVDAEFLSGGARLVDRLRHLALPLLTLSLIGIGGAARFSRAAMRAVRDSPYLVAARARGLPQSEVVVRHQLRSALVPIVTLLGLSLPAVFSGAVFVEAIFGWPGVGQLLVQAVQARDYPVVMAAATVSAVLVVTGNLLAEFLTGVVDPRVRHAGA